MATTKYSKYHTFIKPVVENKIVRSSVPYIFSLLAIIVFTVFAIRPTISTILSLQKKIEDNTIVLKALNKKVEDLSQGKTNLENIDQDIKNKIKASLPEQTNVTSLISNLQGSTQNQATVSGLQIQPITIINNIEPLSGTKQQVGEATFTYNMQGSYNELLNILQNIAKTKRLITVDSVVMNKQSEGPITLSITGKGYYLK